MNLPPELEKTRRVVRGYAQEFGLDFFEVVYEVLTYEQMNAIAAFGGFPTRYPHWRFGMEYEHLSKSYAYGLHRIYEMVINNDPCYAYLLEANPLVDQKLVMAHVYGHADFFTHNVYFAHTDRKMMDRMANHGTIIRKAMEQHGVSFGDAFIDIDKLRGFKEKVVAKLTGGLAGMAKQIPCDPPLLLKIAVLMPINRPSMATSAPPELPGLIAASV